MSGQRRLNLWIGLASACAACASTHAQCLYEVASAAGPDCGFPFGPTYITGLGVNAFGEAVGYYRKCSDSSQHVAVRWTEESGVAPLTGFPAGTEHSEAFDINDAGQIVGLYDVYGDGNSRLGFLIDEGAFVPLGTLPNGTVSTPEAINELGDVVGHAGNHVKGPIEAFLWRDGRMQTLDGMAPANDSRASDINDKGQIVGRYNPTTEGGGVVRHAFLWDSGTFTDIGVIPGGISGEATAINNHGHVVGYGRINLPEGGFVRKPFIWIDGEMTIIELPPEHEGCYFATDINDSGQVLICDFIWQDGAVTELQALVPPDVELKSLWQITNEGAIVGRAHVQIPGEPGDTASALAVLTPQTPLTDLTGDCRTDAADLRILLGQWGNAEDDSSTADFNDDGVVDPEDLAILLGNWG